jgi:hypothetical protein
VHSASAFMMRSLQLQTARTDGIALTMRAAYRGSACTARASLSARSHRAVVAPVTLKMLSSKAVWLRSRAAVSPPRRLAGTAVLTGETRLSATPVL